MAPAVMTHCPSSTLAPVEGPLAIASPVGWLVLETAPEGVCGLGFSDQLPTTGFRQQPGTELETRLLNALNRYFAGLPEAFQDIPLAPPGGTPFQKRVWAALRAIGYGETQSYAWLARAVGNPRAYRAVGQANRANPLPILIPCHRVVSADGQLGGYMGSRGLAIKRALLSLEQAGVRHWPA